MNTASPQPPRGGSQALIGPLPDAVLWDMDGTLVDTEPYWIASEFAIAERHGGAWSHDHGMALVGNDLMESARYIRQVMGIEISHEQILDELLDGVVERVRQEIPWRPGARELLAALNEAQIACALVTMSYQRLVDPILEQLAPGTFATVVTGDQVSHGKPHPEPYLVAAERLGVAAQHCVAIEDSDTGARSAESAGTQVLVVPNHVQVPSGTQRHFFDSLEAVTLADLVELRRRAPERP